MTIRDIAEGEQLKVWYSPYYALMMKKELLNQPQIKEEQAVQPVGEFSVLFHYKAQTFTLKF